MTSSGEFYASCLYDDEKEQPTSNSEGKAIGLDLGLTHFVITSDVSTETADHSRYCLE